MIYVSQEEITVLRVHKDTRDKLRKRAITKRESYEEIINRLLESDAESEGIIGNMTELERRKQRLLKIGVSKEIVNLLGVVQEVSLENEKRVIRNAIVRKMMQ